MAPRSEACVQGVFICPDEEVRCGADVLVVDTIAAKRRGFDSARGVVCEPTSASAFFSCVGQKGRATRKRTANFVTVQTPDGYRLGGVSHYFLAMKGLAADALLFSALRASFSYAAFRPVMHRHLV